MTARITNVMPREQAGPQTGRKYEVQYEEAALACLELLRENSAACVYCEWHDDFVVEHVEPSKCSYAFHQVKTRSDAKGAWSMFEVLGVKKPPKAKPPKPAKSQKGSKAKAATPNPPKPVKLSLREPRGESIAMRMLDHHRKFKDACALFVLVTPSDVSVDPMLDLVEAAKPCASPDKLTPEQLALFHGLLKAHQEHDATVTQDELWALLKRLRIAVARASEPEPKVAVGLMGQLIHELSEVDVSISEQGRIADALLKVVRDRSHKVLDVLPGEDDLRGQKAVSLREVIKLLPLSVDGWERLRKGETAAVKTLSRLQRICRRSGMSDEMIVAVCGLKLDWHEWKNRVDDTLTKDMGGVLRERGLKLLHDLKASTSSTPFQDLQQAAETMAKNMESLPRMPRGLTPDIIMGLVFALAAESE